METYYICSPMKSYFKKFFNTLFLPDAIKFIDGLDSSVIRKIFYIIDQAEHSRDPKIFKKIDDDIWEFRIRYLGLQIRILAFWDKTNKSQTLVIACHGFIKKVDKVPIEEIKRAIYLRKKYFNEKR
ncbi:MAG TPA: type II toxin-antitoxin system RelE/ParE family toxin [Saprospiraceae bacterium]|nr:type II toxin-antitoxin system RelE/ParE family toxin [Saprospiraceae bacterium]